MASHMPIYTTSDQVKKLMELLGMPKNVRSFVIRGDYNDVLEVELIYMPSEDVFDEVLNKTN